MSSNNNFDVAVVLIVVVAPLWDADQCLRQLDGLD